MASSVKGLLEDFIGLYARDTLPRWRGLFRSGLYQFVLSPWPLLAGPDGLRHQTARTGYRVTSGSGLRIARPWTMAWQTSIRSNGSR